MLAPQPPGGTLPGYSFTRPTEADACAALTRVFGAERADHYWSTACRGAELRPGHIATDEALGRAVQALAALGGAVAVVARSMEIRIRTYARLSARLAQAPEARA